MILLDKNGWSSKYDELVSQFKIDFFKLEVLPSYNDYGVDNWDAIRGDELRDLIVKSQRTILNSMKSQIDLSVARKATTKRVRYLEFPLSKYILRQFSVYKVYAELGVDIEFLEGKDSVVDLPKSYFRDFLLFDDSAILLLDNPNGYFSGGFYSENPDEISPFLNLKKSISNRTVPFKKYMHDLNISFDILV